MIRQMFLRAPRLGAALGLAMLLGGCSVVGYPTGVTAPAPVHTAPGGAATSRTYEVFGVRYTTLSSADDYAEVGLASWYGEKFHGRRTANGEVFDMYGLTAAHRTLPLPTCVEVRRTDDGRSVVVRVNDRGPFAPDERRIIDLSYSAAEAIGLVRPGTAEVEVRALAAGQDC